MAGFEGKLSIDLVRAGAAIDRVSIASSRPLQASSIFRGRGAEETLKTLPLLYSVCGTAQAQAAVSAVERAMGRVPDAAVGVARELLLWLETAREHLWRIMIDWPELLQEPSAKHRLGPLMQLLPDARRGLFGDGEAFLPGAVLQLDRALVERVLQILEAALEREVFGCSGSQWRSMTASAAIEAWIERRQTPASRLLHRLREKGWASMGASPVAMLPSLDSDELARRFDAEDAADFIARPTWQGRVYETTALSRQLDWPPIARLLANDGNGLMTRLLARLAELARIPAELQGRLNVLEGTGETQVVTASAAGNGIGLAQVEAARGRLIHRVELHKGTVVRYQILAPTEWNFHPRGVLAQGFKTLRAGDPRDLRWLCSLLVNAIDPCVGYDLRLA